MNGRRQGAGCPADDTSWRRLGRGGSATAVGEEVERRWRDDGWGWEAARWPRVANREEASERCDGGWGGDDSPPESRMQGVQTMRYGEHAARRTTYGGGTQGGQWHSGAMAESGSLTA